MLLTILLTLKSSTNPVRSWKDRRKKERKKQTNKGVVLVDKKTNRPNQHFIKIPDPELMENTAPLHSARKCSSSSLLTNHSTEHDKRITELNFQFKYFTLLAHKVNVKFPCARHSLLTSALDADEWLTSRSGRFTPGNEPRQPLNRKLDGPQSRSGRFGEDTNLLPLPGFEPRTVRPVA
jgi:hypothetical protein